MSRAESKRKIFGILSLVAFAISMLPMLGIISILGIVLGIVSIVRERHVTGILGTIFSMVSLAISPTVWALLASAWIGVYCTVADCGKIVAKSLESAVKSPEGQKMIEKMVEHSARASGNTDYPPSWKKTTFSENPETKKLSAFGAANFMIRGFHSEPNASVIYMDVMIKKDATEPTDVFIQDFVKSVIMPIYANVRIKEIDPVTIQNAGDSTLNKARLWLVTNGAPNRLEVVAVVDSGDFAYLQVISVPDQNALRAAWPTFSDIVINRISFKVTRGSDQQNKPAPTNASPLIQPAIKLP